MNEEKTLREILAKFKDGETRYQHNPLFHLVVTQIIKGQDLYAIIDHLLEHRDTIIENYKQILERIQRDNT